MTVHVSRLPFSLDPLITEAKRRMRRRRLFVAAVLVFVFAGTAAGVVAVRSPVDANRIAATSQPAGTRWCGYLGLGIGWRVGASSTLSCRSGRTFMRKYISAGAWPAPARFQGYACTFRVLPTQVGSFTCVSGKTAIVAVSNH